MAFQVQAVGQLRNHFGLAGAGQATEHHKPALCRRSLRGADEEPAHGLVAPHHPGVVDARFVQQPLLHDLRAQPATKAVQHALRMHPRKLRPRLDTLALDGARHQLVPQRNRGLLTLVLVAGAHLLALTIVHQGEVGNTRKRALPKLHRRAHIHHGHIVQEDVPVVRQVVGHQRSATAKACRGVSSPIGCSARPSSAATCRNSASPSGLTATSSPPLVWGSHSRCFCTSVRGAILAP